MMNREHIYEEITGRIKGSDSAVVVLASAVYAIKERASADRKQIRFVESSSLTTDGGEAINVDRNRLLIAATGEEIVVAADDLKTIIQIGQGKYEVSQH